MFKSFIAWLDSYISREEPSAILKALIGLMAFAGLLGTIFGNQTIRVGAFVVVVVFVTSVILLLVADRRRLQRAYDVHRNLLALYCDFVIDNHPKPLISVEDWRQVTHIHPNGDVRETLKIQAIALRREVHFIRLKAGSGWEQPEKYRREVKVIARSLTVNNLPGPQWHVTRSWRSTDKMTSIIHFHQPVRRGEEIRFEVVRIWPRKCHLLMREGAVDAFTFRNSSLIKISNVEHTIVLPLGTSARYEAVGFNEGDPDSPIRITVNDDSTSFCFTAETLPDKELVGIRLELK